MDKPAHADNVMLRMFVEEVCCELCRFHHATHDGCLPEDVQIDREVALASPDAFADIRVVPPGGPRYFVEVKVGYPNGRVVSDLCHKYAGLVSAEPSFKLILVIDRMTRGDTDALIGEITEQMGRHLNLEVWDETELDARLTKYFKVRLGRLDEANPAAVRVAIDEAKWRHAFRGRFMDSPLRSTLLWHFGFWKLRQLHEDRGWTPEQILRPEKYDAVTVVLADLCSFSSYVRDTPSHTIVRSCLTEFYSKARFQVINAGAMMYQFVGDEVVALFGVPSSSLRDEERAIACARSLVDVGNSVSNQWQRRIDRVQEKRGVHIGIVRGEMQIVALRPYSRTHIGGIGDAINLCARLLSFAGPSEILVGNTFFERLSGSAKERFEELEPIDARNVGRVKAWKWAVSATARV